MIGARLGNWVLDRQLGHGGMGYVYLAHEEAPAGRLAAVKVLTETLSRDPGFLSRFEREIDILRRLDHPNIVRLYEAGQQDGCSYFAMEYVDGQTLEVVLQQCGRLPWLDVLFLAQQLCRALKHAHDHGIIHRDLKPANLMLTPLPNTPGTTPQDVRIKLTDFGIAKLFAATHLTVAGHVVGTPEYLSPEQAAGKPVTPRSDLYSLGAVLYTMLTGRALFQGHTVADLLHKHVYARFDRPGKLVPEIPHELDEIVCSLLEKDPANRPADAGVAGRALDQLMRKQDRRSNPTLGGVPQGHTLAEQSVEQAGPATLASRLVRRELEEQNRRGPLMRFLERPVVLVLLLICCLSVLTWTFWPASAATLFERGTALMASADSDDWYNAWDWYLGPLERDHPSHPYKEQVAQYRQRLDAHLAERQAARGLRDLPAAVLSEAQWFYYQGLHLRAQGDEQGAQRIWRDLARGFREVPSQQAWVRLAERQLSLPEPPAASAAQRWSVVREAVRRARQLREQGRNAEADAILDALHELYRNDSSAKQMQEEITAARKP